jgi:hypothetical protein
MRIERLVASTTLKLSSFIGIGSVNIASESKDTLLGRHFEHQVRVVRHSHEFGEH